MTKLQEDRFPQAPVASLFFMRLRVWLSNAPGIPARAMARYLRKRGWVVFYLAPEQRKCSGGFCWLETYAAVTGKTAD